jgi:hypothetical protein
MGFVCYSEFPIIGLYGDCSLITHFATLSIFSCALRFYQNSHVCYLDSGYPQTYHYNVRYLSSGRYFSKITHSYVVRYLNIGRVKWKTCMVRE